VAVLLAVLVAGAVTAAEASIPRPERWPSLLEEPAASVLEPPTLEDLAAELAAPATSQAPATAAVAGERFRLFEGLQIGVAWRSEPRFRLYPRPKTRVWAITLPEPVHIELALPLTPSRFRLYGHPRAGIAVGGTFITPDPLGFIDGPSPYAFALNNPVNYSDPMGLDAIAIAFVDYLITVDERRVPGLGHAAVITIDDTGYTKYFEYGRYDPARRGVTKNPGILNVDIGSNGLPTEESLKRMLHAVSKASGEDSRISAAYFVTDEESTAKMTQYGLECVQRNKDPEREPYSIWSNNCGTFAEDVIEAGGVNLPIILDPRPNARAPVWQKKADFSIEYDPKTDELKVEESFFTADKQEILEWKELPLWKRLFVAKPH